MFVVVVVWVRVGTLIRITMLIVVREKAMMRIQIRVQFSGA
jgi:hypothetical protein